MLSPFHLTNGRGISSHIEMLLNRCFCSTAWLDAWPITNCSTLVRHSSDHNHLLVSFQKFAAQVPTPFRFHHMRLDHPDFINLVKFMAIYSSLWLSYVYSSTKAQVVKAYSQTLEC